MCFVNSANLKQDSRVHDKVELIHFAISETANISAQIENKSGWVMLAIRRVMLAIPPSMLAVTPTMDAVHPVQDIPHLVQHATNLDRRLLWQELD
jgi:hypothetical protein